MPEIPQMDFSELRVNLEIILTRASELRNELNSFKFTEKEKSIKELLGKTKSSGLNEFCKRNYKNYF